QNLSGCGRILLATPAVPHVAHLRSEIGALAKQRVTIDAGVLLPDVLAARHRGGQFGLVGGRIHHVVVTVGRQTKEDCEEEGRSAVEDVPSSRFREAFSHHPSFPVWLARASRLSTQRPEAFFVLEQVPERLNFRSTA